MAPLGWFEGFETEVVDDEEWDFNQSLEEVLAKLNDYVLLLSEAQEKDNYANNRPMFTKRLAVAAEMYAHLHKNNEIAARTIATATRPPTDAKRFLRN